MRIAIIYGSTTGVTQRISQQIKDLLGDIAAEPVDVTLFDPRDVAKYDALLLGIPTWNIGEMQEDWEDAASGFLIPEIRGKKIAIFGCGDQGGYPDTFGDAHGLLWNILEPAGPALIGTWPTDGYEYDGSAAERDGRFLGLIVDDDHQPELSDIRVREWCEQIKRELGLTEVLT
ncbi:MAG: flavodoxin [Planctomycetota bacterium]